MAVPTNSIVSKRPRVEQRVEQIRNWPTVRVSIDFCNHDDDSSNSNNDDEQVPFYPHTVLLFVPGNPGCIEWYIPFLHQLVLTLGLGYAARGVSYAAHGTTDDVCNVQDYIGNNDKDTCIPWTVNGQMDHKIAWIDMVVDEMKDIARLSTTAHHHDGTCNDEPRFVVLTHSIGAHLVQRLLVLRPDLLGRTQLVIHLMPFLRMDAPEPQQTILSTIAEYSNPVIVLAQTLSRMFSYVPYSWLDYGMHKSVPAERGREIAISVLRQPHMARNLFELGSEEIRDLPQVPDTWALQLIGETCPTRILFCGDDHWSPLFHMEELHELQRYGHVPPNVLCTYMEGLRHDFVTKPTMVAAVESYCLEKIRRTAMDEQDALLSRPELLSRL